MTVPVSEVDLWRRLTPCSVALALALCAQLLLAACSIRTMAINALAESLAASGDVFAADSDPELVRDATPFALKTIEALLEEKPDHRGLLLSACRGFTQYSFAFVETEAERLVAVDYHAAEKQYDRALRLYLRARDYCLRALELEAPGIGTQLRGNPDQPLHQFELSDVPLLYWTGAAWGSAINVGQARPEIVADLPAVRALMDRALQLDETFDRGAIHEALIALESLPEAMGGSADRARFHFDRAVELSRGFSVSPYVSLAEGVAVAAQNWREFQHLLEIALAVDPEREPSLRLANIIAQRRARWLLDRIDELFLDYEVEVRAPGS